jgi:L-serine dehydratase
MCGAAEDREEIEWRLVKTSIFELFKIGIGPSSSHTVGPMRAARAFLLGLDLPVVTRVKAELYGSLALTGIGHGTDRAVLLGLAGELPETVDPDRVIAADNLPFQFDLVFHNELVLPGHPNAMRFTAWNASGEIVSTDVYFSIGGGFIRRDGDPVGSQSVYHVPYPFSSAEELLSYGLPVWKLMMANESAITNETEVRNGIIKIWEVMRACMEKGLVTEGILPGGLRVRRRAPRYYKRVKVSGTDDPMNGLDYLNAFAMAVNEENAAGGRVVTAPTNGAAGLLPAVVRYYKEFLPGADREGLVRFFLTAGAIGILYQENASISGAEVGCQGEVGVACSMAAGGLAAALGGTNEHIEQAAEIGMEHHLGMTCDPIGGLVQIPCIERNAFGAVKAVNACRMAMRESGGHKVSLDQVIQTMYQTGLDMQSRYKETSQAGLAVNVVEC